MERESLRKRTQEGEEREGREEVGEEHRISKRRGREKGKSDGRG